MDSRKRSFIQRVAGHWNGLHREVAIEFKKCLDNVQAHGVTWAILGVGLNGPYGCLPSLHTL